MANNLEKLRVSPAAHLAQAMQDASVAGTTELRELPFTPQIGLRCIPGSESAKALEDVLGVTLPAGVQEVTGDLDARQVIWLSPDEFLAIDVSRTQQPGEGSDLEAALEGLPGQAVDLSANRTIIELSGRHAREVLEKGCRADLHPRVFPVGAAIATQLAQAALILQRSGEDSFRLLPRASFADYTVRWLLDAVREYASAAETGAADA